MNESKADPDPDQAAEERTLAGEPTMVEAPPEPSGRDERERTEKGAWRLPVTLALIAAIAVVGWQWYDTRSRIDAIRAELGQRLRASDSSAEESRILAKQALEGAREAQAKLSTLENRIAESQSQQVSLEALYQELSRNRDEWALAEIEQTLNLASQQLQLTGNVEAALLALRAAEARLARAGQPQFAALRRALNRDIERLKAAPSVDIAGMAQRLDQLIDGVDRMPLHLDEPMQPGSRTDQAEAGYAVWERVLIEIWKEMKQLVRIRVVDEPEAELLSPAQSYFLRQNLQLRLLDARQALLARDPARFRSDLATAQAWIKRYYDTHAQATAAAQAGLKQLAASSIAVELPTIDASLAAVRKFKVSHEKAAR